MVNRDKTGPEGKGPLTGRGLGPCKKKVLGDPIEFLGRGRDLDRKRRR